MSAPNQDEMARFKAESDRAFAQWKASVDQNMATFIEKYGANTGEFKTKVSTPALYPSSSPNQLDSKRRAPEPHQAQQVQSTAAAEAIRAAQEVSKGAIADVASGSPLPNVNRAHLNDSKQDLMNDFTQYRHQAQQDVHNTAREALQGTKDILKGVGADLGKRAQQEAQALRDAARKAAQEEKDLKAIRGRAQKELEAAKQRMRSQAGEVKQNVMDSMKGLAGQAFEDVRETATGAFDSGKASLQREFDDLMTGQDTPDQHRG